jgi:hypothetical protein
MLDLGGIQVSTCFRKCRGDAFTCKVLNKKTGDFQNPLFQGASDTFN